MLVRSWDRLGTFHSHCQKRRSSWVSEDCWCSLDKISSYLWSSYSCNHAKDKGRRDRLKRISDLKDSLCWIITSIKVLWPLGCWFVRKLFKWMMVVWPLPTTLLASIIPPYWRICVCLKLHQPAFASRDTKKVQKTRSLELLLSLAHEHGIARLKSFRFSSIYVLIGAALHQHSQPQNGSTQ